ncbi:MAG: ribonuclease J [Chthonomonadales bacterium]|nr:ribonuclease J [Chthonomonadales bacterium]
MIVIRHADDIVVIDAGVTFPSADHPGIDLIVPDMTYLSDNADNVRAVVLTHGHEDHIGAVPFLLRRVQAPIYGTPLTLGLVRERLQEHHLLEVADLRIVQPGERITFGHITVEPIRVTHSIPDTISLAITTPAGLIVHTGDFKIDHTPVDGRSFDAARFAQLGDDGVVLLITDSVNAEKPGWVPSERIVGRFLDQQFDHADGRILVTTFASNIHRIQQFFEVAADHGRKVAIAGRSMQRNVRIARELDYLRYDDSLSISVDDLENWPDDRVAILTTGSQGEPFAALSQMATDRHKIRIKEGDTVILSSTPIPGNEIGIWRTVNRLINRGARVVYDLITPVHASGHANQEELKLMYSLTRPLYVVPFHGEPRMMQAYTDMVMGMGAPRDSVIWLQNGDRLGLDGVGAEKLEPLEITGSVFVDGTSADGISDLVLRDRRHLAEGGTVVVTLTRDFDSGEILSGPEFVARGFLSSEDTEDLFLEAASRVRDALDDLSATDDVDAEDAGTVVRDTVARLLRKRTRLRPVVLPIVTEI